MLGVRWFFDRLTGRTGVRPVCRLPDNPSINPVRAAALGGPRISETPHSKRLWLRHHFRLRAAWRGGPYRSVSIGYCGIRWSHGPPRAAARTALIIARRLTGAGRPGVRPVRKGSHRAWESAFSATAPVRALPGVLHIGARKPLCGRF